MLRSLLLVLLSLGLWACVACGGSSSQTPVQAAGNNGGSTTTGASSSGSPGGSSSSGSGSTTGGSTTGGSTTGGSTAGGSTAGSGSTSAGGSTTGSASTGSSGSGSTSSSSGSTGSSGSGSTSSSSGSTGSTSGSGSGSTSSSTGTGSTGSTGSGTSGTSTGSTGTSGSSGSSSTPSPAGAAFVFVSATGSSGSHQINGFTAGADGRLTEISGSPFKANDGSLSISGSHLFGMNLTSTNIDAFAIGSNGALTAQTSTNYQQYSNHCGSGSWLFTDHTGADLYDLEFNGDCANNFYQSFATDSANGSLTYLGTVNGGAGSFNGIYLPAAFLGNNAFAYEATNNGCMYYGVSTFARASSGVLSTSAASTTLPAPPPNFRTYIPTFLATDSTNHVAMTLLPANPPGCEVDVQVQIASFTAAANGDLTTTNTFATMPTTAIRGVTDLKISPAGDLLAIGGTEGLQIFHFNGASPATAYTGILTVDPVQLMFWDKQNHLYVASLKANRLHVFTVTPTNYVEAPGSPYPIQQPLSVAVDPLQ